MGWKALHHYVTQQWIDGWMYSVNNPGGALANYFVALQNLASMYIKNFQI
jgi:hypothetical protein